MAVEEEPQAGLSGLGGRSADDLSDHEKKLLLEYKTKEQTEQTLEVKGHQKGHTGQDCYEKSAPRHGDIGFHKFVQMIRKHPGQVLR